jgi:hypothetical protein
MRPRSLLFSRRSFKVIKRLRSLGLIPAMVVTAVLAAALVAPPVGAGLQPFLACAYPSYVTLSAAPPSPQNSGTPVVFTASFSGCSTPSQLYEFWMRAASQSSWQLVQAYSSSATYNWNSTGAAAGGVYFGVWVKDATSTTSTFDANNNLLYTVSPCSSASSIGASPTSINEGSGTHSTLTGSTSGCATLFEFWLRTATSVWILVQSYSTKATYDWNSAGSPFGIIYFGVWVKVAQSGTSTFDSNASTTVTVNQAKCTGATATPAAATVTNGSNVKDLVTATATGCTNATGQLFEFWLRTTSTGWVMVQAFSTTATYNWDTTGAPVTTVYIGVWVKDMHSSSSSFDANATATVTVN